MRTSTTQPPLGTMLNRSHPLAQGLVVNWLFNEGGGLKCFNSAGVVNVPGVLTNGAIFQQSARGNVVLMAVSGTKYINLGTSAALQFNPTSPFSISAWVRPTASTNSFIISYTNASFTGWYVAYNSIAANGFYFDYPGAANYTRCTSAAGSVPLNVWTHIVGTRDGLNATTSNTTYVNGTLNATKSNSGTPTAPNYATNVINIGAGNNVSLPFPGQIGDVKIWNRCLSPTEIRQLYTNPYQMFQGGTTLKK